jgi:hypothetical protein
VGKVSSKGCVACHFLLLYLQTLIPTLVFFNTRVHENKVAIIHFWKSRLLVRPLRDCRLRQQINRTGIITTDRPVRGPSGLAVGLNSPIRWPSGLYAAGCAWASMVGNTEYVLRYSVEECKFGIIEVRSCRFQAKYFVDLVQVSAIQGY